MIPTSYGETYFNQLVLVQGTLLLKKEPITLSHQVVFTKNFELLKVKYAKKISPCLESELLQSQYDKAKIISSFFQDR